MAAIWGGADVAHLGSVPLRCSWVYNIYLIYIYIYMVRRWCEPATKDELVFGILNCGALVVSLVLGPYFFHRAKACKHEL